MANRVFIAAAKRTAIGSFGGSLASVSAQELGATVIRAALQQANIVPDLVDEVIVGCVLTAGQGQGVGRQAAIKAGIPAKVPAYTINMICGSGMKSLINAFTSIRADEANIIVAAGMENMSSAAYVVDGRVRSGVKMGNMSFIDTMINDGLTDAFNGYHMGITAENIAEFYSITREEQDIFAAQSQQRAIDAIEAGHFVDEIVPVSVRSHKETIEYAIDEYPRRGTTVEMLGKLRAAFKKDGSVTAGNASGVNDGAVALVVVSEAAVKEHSLTPLAEIVSVGQGGVEPSVMGLGPVPSIRNALCRADLNLSDIDRLELNEAFAAQALGVMLCLSEEHGVTSEWLSERTNLNGGAIALGHPVGASGGRIVTTLLYEMQRSNSNLGLASLCIGGGMGTAVILRSV